MPSSSKIEVGDASGTTTGHTAMPNGRFNPEMKELLIIPPVVALYLPIVLLFSVRDENLGRPVTGMRQNAAATPAQKKCSEAAQKAAQS